MLVSSPAEKPDLSKRKRVWRRLLQFRLRTILLLTTVVAIWLGWWMTSARQQREAVAALRKIGAYISYDFQERELEQPEALSGELVVLHLLQNQKHIIKK